MSHDFGGGAPARRILICLYATIAIASGGLIAMLWPFPDRRAAQMAVALLTFQIADKLLTLPALGVSHPVARTNLAIAAFHGAALGLVSL